MLLTIKESAGIAVVTGVPTRTSVRAVLAATPAELRTNAMSWLVPRFTTSSSRKMTWPAGLIVMSPEVVVDIVRFAEVELTERVPAPASSMELPVPAFSTCRTLPVEEA